MNRYLLLADVVAVFHAAYVAFVTIGFALIAAGIAMGWNGFELSGFAWRISARSHLYALSR
jgi:hypothetical protein